jgi:tetratricopeptide (TPR) repeat protein
LAGLITSLNKSKVELPSRYRSHFAVYQAQIALSNNQVSSNKQKAKQQQAAKQHLRSALTTDPSNGDALLILAKLLREQGQDEQAILYLIRAEALPLFKERGLLARSQLEIDRKNYPEALRLLQQVTQMNPNRKDVFANIRSLKHLVRVQG